MKVIKTSEESGQNRKKASIQAKLGYKLRKFYPQISLGLWLVIVSGLWLWLPDTFVYGANPIMFVLLVLLLFPIFGYQAASLLVKNSNFQVLAACATVAIGVAIPFFRATELKKNLSRSGIVTTGIVNSARFSDDDEYLIRAVFLVNGMEYQTYAVEDVTETIGLGDEVNVIYQPRAPSINRLILE